MDYKKYLKLNPDIVKVRAEIFIKEQGFKNEFDKIDKNCTHVVFYDKNIPIAVCRYYKENNIYHIGRLALIKEYRDKHLGSKIMKIVEEEIKKEGGSRVTLSAQVRVKKFYSKNGYKEIGNIYFDEHCEHIRMEKFL